MLRHGPSGADRILATFVAYAVAGSVLAAVYALGSIWVTLAFGSCPPMVVALLTGGCAAAVSPLRAGLQRRVVRRLHPMRAAGLQALHSAAGPNELQEALRFALGDPGLRVLFLRSDGGGAFAVDGIPVLLDHARAVPVIADGSTVGFLVPDTGCVSLALLRDTARSIAVLVDRARLRIELALTLCEAGTDRITSVLRERSRMERQLHDTTQQRLVALTLALRLAEQQIQRGAVRVEDLIDTTVADLQATLDELRRVIQGRPPADLDDGLGKALHRLSGRIPIPVHLYIDGEPLPNSWTAYALVSEAITNTLKHADATQIDLSVINVDGWLRVRVTDNGRGGAVPKAGSGLYGLADQVTAAGGNLEVVSPPGAGTVIRASLPAHAGHRILALENLSAWPEVMSVTLPS